MRRYSGQRPLEKNGSLESASKARGQDLHLLKKQEDSSFRSALARTPLRACKETPFTLFEPLSVHFDWIRSP